MVGGFTTSKGRVVSGLLALNEGVWSGTKNADESIVLGTDASLAVSAAVDGKRAAKALAPTTYIRGRILFGRQRNKGPEGVVPANALVVDADFADADVHVVLHLHFWIDDCRPVVQAEAGCWPGIEQTERHLVLSSELGLLGNVKNRDLCAAVHAEPVTACKAGGDLEFPTFACAASALPSPLDPSAVAERLQLRWTDAAGLDLGSGAVLYLDYLPRFPVTLAVENEWGGAATSVVATAPTGAACPLPVLALGRPLRVIFRGPFASFVTPSLHRGTYRIALAGKDAARARAAVRVGALPQAKAFDCVTGPRTRACEVRVRGDAPVFVTVTATGRAPPRDVVLTATRVAGEKEAPEVGLVP